MGCWVQSRIQSRLFVMQTEGCNVEYRVDCHESRRENPKKRLIDKVEHKP